MFLTTHYMEEADVLCNRIAIIDYGKIIALDAPQNLKDGLGGDIIELELNDISVDITTVLTSMPQVREVKRTNNLYRIKVAKRVTALPKIIENVLKMKLEIGRVLLTKPTLDQVYLDYTGRSLRETQRGADEEVRRMRRMRG